MLKICTKAYRTLGLLKRNLSACPEKVKLQAYKGLIRPVLEYASTAWDPWQDCLQKKLEAVQKSAARFITSNYSYEEGSMTNIMNKLKLDSLKERRKQNRLILFCKGIKHQANIPTEILKIPTFRSKNSHSMPYINIGTNKNANKFSFMPATVADWNILKETTIQAMNSAVDPVKSFAAIVRGGNY